MGRYEETLEDLNKLLEIEPDNSYALKNRGLTYCTMRKYQKSLDDLNKSLEIDKNNAITLENREVRSYL